MKLAAFTHNLEVNGSNKFLFLLLKRQKKKFSKISLFSPVDGPLTEDFLHIGIEVQIVPMSTKGYRKELSSKIGQFDVGIVNTMIRAEAICTLSDLGIPALWVIHESWAPEDFEHIVKNIWKWEWPDQETILEAFKNAKIITYPAAAAQKLYQKITSNALQLTIPNGIDLYEIEQTVKNCNRPTIRQRFNLSNDDFLIIVVGSINERKNQLAAVEAFNSIKDKKNLKLLLVGARNIREHEIIYTKKIEQYIAKNELNTSIMIHPLTRDIYSYYIAADAVLCTSISEVLPYAVMEAMAFGLPVVASNIDGIPELIEDGVNGLLTTPGDTAAIANSLICLAKKPSISQQFRGNSIAKVKKDFDLEIMLSRYEDLVQDTLLNRKET